MTETINGFYKAEIIHRCGSLEAPRLDVNYLFLIDNVVSNFDIALKRHLVIKIGCKIYGLITHDRNL